MALRLTLRTLLAYLDDTLEPAQAKAIGQKVAESDSARELIERIKQVTRRRRLTAPSAGGPGSQLDPNTVADYLDNEVSAEQAEEVEQICLSSDVHLAEVAACHQILTLILGEPIKPPAAAAQRMIGLVKGPEAIPGRRAAPAKMKSTQPDYAESGEIDETLRFGIPALGNKGGWRNPLLLIGGGVLAVALLVLAVFQILKAGRDAEPRIDNVAQADLNPNENNPDKTVRDKNSDKTRPNPADNAKSTNESTTIAKKGGKTDKTNPPKQETTPGKVAPLPAMDVAFGPPSPREAVIGKYVPDPKESSILLQSVPDKKLQWQRLSAQAPDVLSARPLVSLPASRGIVQTNRGVRLELWGNAPEFIGAIAGNGESSVELFTHEGSQPKDQLDLDVLLKRGRVVFTSTRTDKKDNSVYVRVRFDNPHAAAGKDAGAGQAFLDFTLAEPGATLLVDRWSGFLAGEPFYKDAKNPSRIGPLATVACVAVKGTVYIKCGGSTYTMSPAPGPAVIAWNSLMKSTDEMKPPIELKAQPESTLPDPPLPKDLDPKIRALITKARASIVSASGNVARQLAQANVDVGLAQALQSPDPSTRLLVVRGLAALDDLPSVLEAADQSKQNDVRAAALQALRVWIAQERDNDYKLFNVLKQKYKHKEAEIIMELLHGFSAAELQRPERYEILIDYLDNPNLVIRELGFEYLYSLVPTGRDIEYSAVADASARARAVQKWRNLIPPGQLPPKQAPAAKKR